MASHAFEHDDRRSLCAEAVCGAPAALIARPAADSSVRPAAREAACLPERSLARSLVWIADPACALARVAGPALARVAGPAPARARTVAFAIAFALMLASLLVVASPKAFADEGDQNLVDPTQRADNSFIYDTTIESLFDQSSLYENRTVQVVGEAIGDRITSTAAKGNCWITLTVTDSEDKSSISVLMSDEQANQIDHFGKYGVTGTILQVRGTYHQACGEHEGLPDIHATEVSVMARGVEHPDTFTLREFVPGVIAIGIGIVLMAVFYVARERTR